MFDHDALELIQNTAVKASGVQSVMGVDIPQLAVPSGINLIDIEKLQEHRSRFRGTYSTSQLAEFVAYTNARDADLAPPVRVFVAPDQNKAVAFFNIGTDAAPGHCDDMAVLRLQHTAAQAALFATIDKPMAQRALAEWLEDWADCLTPIYPLPDGKEQNLSRAIAAVRDITISSSSKASSQVGDFGASRSAMEDIEAKSQLVLPQGFNFVCQPFDGFDYVHWRLRLTVLTDSDKPKLVLRTIGKEDALEKIAKEFEQKVRDGLREVEVFRGSFNP